MSWISAKEQLPDNDLEDVLVITKDGHYFVGSYIRCFGGVWCSVEGEFDLDVTHWMPLPPTPMEMEEK